MNAAANQPPNDSSQSSDKDSGKSISSGKRRHRHHHSHGRPMTIRTKIMRHVSALTMLGAFFLLSAYKESGVEYTDNTQLAFYLVMGFLIYYITLKMYPTVHRAWEDSKK